MTSPVRMARAKRDSLAFGPLVTCGTLATTRAIAPVACTDMKTELVKNAPVKVPTI